VATGKADAAITFFGAGYYFQTKYRLSNLRFAAVYDRESSLESFGVRKDWSELVAILDKALAELGGDRLNALNRKWNTDSALLDALKQDIMSPIKKWVLIGLGTMLAVVFLAFAVVTLWNRSLHRQVGLKTDELHKELKAHQEAETILKSSLAKIEELDRHQDDPHVSLGPSEDRGPRENLCAGPAHGAAGRDQLWPVLAPYSSGA